MKIKTLEKVQEFLAIVDSCEGDVFLTSQRGDHFNLKSTLTQYIAIASLLQEAGDELELFCSKVEDQTKFMKWFYENPDVL